MMAKIGKVSILLFFLLVSGYAHAQPIKFSGSASMYAESDKLRGVPQERPSGILRWSLNPTLSAYGVPLSINIFLSSEESKLRQAISRFRISFNPKDIAREMINVPRFASYISGIEFGTCYPHYSPYTLSGIPVRGGAAEFNPWLLYLAFTAGKTQRAVRGSSTTREAAYERMLFSGKFGIGKKEKNHIFLTFLHAKDDPNSIPPYAIPITTDTPSPPDTVEALTPKENYLAGVELKLSLFHDKFNLESEIVGSQFTRDVRSAEFTKGDIPSWIKNLIRPKMSSSYDWAYSAKSRLNIFDTRVRGSVRMVGPGFITLGSPYLRNDNVGFEVGIDKSLLNNSISFSTSFTKEHDNLIKWKSSTTSYACYDLSTILTFRGLPYLRLSYVPSTQKNGGRDIRTDILSLGTGYSFTLSGVTNSTNLFFSYMDHEDKSDTTDYVSTNLSLSQSVRFEFPLTIVATASIIQTKHLHESSRILSIDLAGSYVLRRRLSNTIGFNTSTQEKNYRAGLYFNSSFPLWKAGDMNLRIERNLYRDDDKTRNYEHLRVVAVLTRTW